MNFAKSNSNCTFAAESGKSFSSCAFSLIISLVGAALAVSAFLFASIISVKVVIAALLVLAVLVLVIRVVLIVRLENPGFLKQTNQ